MSVKRIHVSLLELAFIAATRGVGGAGVGLLVADLLPRRHRRTIGWTLLTIGALTTVPIAFEVLSRSGPRQVALGAMRTPR